jgi:hypothetical protein
MLTGAPTGGWAMVAWRLILFPVDCADFSAEAMEQQAWFVHELAHTWQFQERPMRTLASWARVALTGGYVYGRAYRYDLPFDWEALNLEQQAKAVEHAFLLTRGFSTADMPAGAAIEAYRSVLTGFRANP